MAFVCFIYTNQAAALETTQLLTCVTTQTTCKAHTTQKKMHLIIMT